LINPFTFNV